jgi:hypothetical protein
MGFIVLTGASGSGKTAIAETIASRYGEYVDVYHFDRIAIPPPEEMIAKYGSGEAWQRAKTHEWMAKIAANHRSPRDVLFEGQMRCTFVLEAAAAAGITKFALILADCDDATAVVAANLGLVAHAAERHADEFTPGRPRDRFAERSLAHARRSDQAEDRSGQLVGALGNACPGHSAGSSMSLKQRAYASELDWAAKPRMPIASDLR